MRLLVGTDSVHATAAICDYLEPRLTETDEVRIVATAGPGDGTAERDGREALNVAPVRLAGAGSVETEFRTGEIVTELLEAAAAVDADEIVVGASSADSEATVGSTTRALLERASRPVVVVPVAALE
ncbi:UspA domain-containing protein [Natronococcus amylolyticus DSM 10524]|uniref:UspA domain-containing protein n=1 Tax=Natronococcus amylolyticus DSM 10524 TaxID=1227497 RepID=L9WYV2_9EURY|nr:universal stress protein [Natronococcus amylolyticus]ELY54670.1 UspA domain-containing protein [Natronococcus amylolyticus DSM 10524]